MGLLRGGDDEVDGGSRFQMREKLLSIGDDYWIDDSAGNQAFRVNGKALRVRQTLILEDPAERGREDPGAKLSVRDKMAIERDGDTVATVKKALVGYPGPLLDRSRRAARTARQGNFVDHEYTVERDGTRSR